MGFRATSAATVAMAATAIAAATITIAATAIATVANCLV